MTEENSMTTDDDGDIEEISPEHPDYVSYGSVYAWHPDQQESAADATCAGSIGHVGDTYFAFYFDQWLELGDAESEEAGLDLLRDYLGVQDPSWIYLG